MFNGNSDGRLGAPLPRRPVAIRDPEAERKADRADDGDGDDNGQRRLVGIGACGVLRAVSGGADKAAGGAARTSTA